MKSGKCVNEWACIAKLENDINDGGTDMNRVGYIDVAKGVGIALVVVGHNPYFSLNYPTLLAILFAFHVPLFFALSGASLRPVMSPLDLMVRSASLIWTYCAVAFMSLPLVIIQKGASFVGVCDAILGIVYATGKTIHPVPLWFLPCLALVLPIASLLITCIEKFFSGNLYAFLILAFGVGFVNSLWLDHAGYVLVERLAWGSLSGQGAPWSADLIGFGVCFAVFGYLARKNIERVQNEGLLMAALVGVVALFALIFIAITPTVDLSERRFSPALGSLAEGFLGVASCLLLCRLIAIRVAWLAVVGGATLPILASHQLLQKGVLSLLSEMAPSLAFICS